MGDVWGCQHDICVSEVVVVFIISIITRNVISIDCSKLGSAVGHVHLLSTYTHWDLHLLACFKLIMSDISPIILKY